MSIFSKLFGTKKKDFTYTGPKPLSSLEGLPGQAEYYKTIQDRVAGRNTGFGEDYASKYSNPIIQNMRNQFQSYTLPELTSDLSVTGRRRGTSGFQQLNKAYENQGLQEGDIFSRLQQRNEDQKRLEMNNAINSLYDYTRNEAAMRDNAANFEYNNIYAPQVQREQDRMARESEGMRNVALATGGLFSPLETQSFLPNTQTLVSQYNPYDYRNFLGYGKSGNSLNDRISQRNRLAGRKL